MTAATQAAFDDDCDYEIVDGQKRVKLAGAKHGELCAQITTELGVYLTGKKVGKIYSSNTTFEIGANERMPNVSFISAPRDKRSGAKDWQSKPTLLFPSLCPLVPGW